MNRPDGTRVASFNILHGQTVSSAAAHSTAHLRSPSDGLRVPPHLSTPSAKFRRPSSDYRKSTGIKNARAESTKPRSSPTRWEQTNGALFPPSSELPVAQGFPRHAGT